jgi:hypothetical protein
MLTFDPIKHEYRDIDGRVVPSVTQILAPLNNFDAVHPDVLAAAQQFGTAVHRACELYDLGTLNIASLDPALLPYLDAWRRFKKDHSTVWHKVEYRLHHQAMGYAGTPDRLGEVEGDMAVVDIKTGTALMPSVGPQLAAYAHAYSRDARAIKRYAVRLHEGGYEVQWYTDPLDWTTFASLLTLRTFCARHNITPNYRSQQQ